jgi:hypothetical protein
LAIIVITTMVTATVTALIIIMAMKGDPSTAAGRGKGLRRVTGGADGRPPGVTTRFVQNRTLSEKSRDFIGFRKRSFAHEFGPDEDSGEFCLQNPLS